MNAMLRLSLVAVFLPAALFAPQSATAQEEMREGRTYLGVLATRLNHRSVEERLLGQGWSTNASLLIGTHVSEHFHAELRAGTGAASGTIDGELEVDVDYYVSWYFGGHYPINKNANAYAQFGFTHLSGESKLTAAGQAREDDPNDNRAKFTDTVGDYPGGSFGISWLAGLDFKVIDDAFVFLEAGKFFEDTETNANIFQYSFGVKYEF